MDTETRPFVSMAQPDLDSHESMSRLLAELMKHSKALIKGEIALIRSELRIKLEIGRTAAVMTGIGLFLAVLAVIALLFAGIMALATFIGVAASALICGGVLGIVAAFLLSKGVSQFKRLSF